MAEIWLADTYRSAAGFPSKSTCVPAVVLPRKPFVMGVTTRVAGPRPLTKRVTISPGAMGPGIKLAGWGRERPTGADGVPVSVPARATSGRPESAPETVTVPV